MKGSLPIFVLLFLSFEFSCSLHSQSIIENSRTTVKKYNLIEGRHNVNLRVTNSETIAVNLSIPKINTNENVPLIIALHWAGGPNTYIEYSECLAFPALEFMNAIIVAPSDLGLHWVTKQNEKRLTKLIDAIIKHWPIDRSKIIITGYSNGGIRSWYYAEKYPELFCTSIPMAGTYNATEISVPLYVIHGKKDELFNLYRVQNTVTQSIAKGSNIHLTLLENHSHYMACAYTETLHKIALKIDKEILGN